MISQRLLDLLREFNNPANERLELQAELLMPDILFLEANGIKVEVLKSSSYSKMCKLSIGTLIKKDTREDEER